MKKIGFMQTTPWITPSTPSTPSTPASPATPPSSDTRLAPSPSETSLAYHFGLLSSNECQAYEAGQERSSSARQADQRAKNLRNLLDQWSEVSVPTGLLAKTLERVSKASSVSDTARS